MNTENKHNEIIEGLDLVPKFGEYSDNEPLDIPTMTTEFVKEHGLPCPNGYIFKDDNGNVINTKKIIMEKKKKEYPKTYAECCYVLGFENTEMVFEDDYRDINPPKEQWKRLGLMNQFNKLLIARDAYWKIAGEEMGLGKPWKPDWKNSEERRYCIVNIEGNINLPEITLTKWILKVTNKILVFPTMGMRDTFYENFKELIEQCKELL